MANPFKINENYLARLQQYYTFDVQMTTIRAKNFAENVDSKVSADDKIITDAVIKELVNNFNYTTMDQAIARVRSATSMIEAAYIFKIIKFRRIKTEKKITSVNASIDFVEEKKHTSFAVKPVREYTIDDFPFVYDFSIKLTSDIILGKNALLIALFQKGFITCGDLNKTVLLATNNGMRFEFFKDRFVLKTRPCYSRNELKKIREQKKSIMKSHAAQGHTLEDSLIAEADGKPFMTTESK